MGGLFGGKTGPSMQERYQQFAQQQAQAADAQRQQQTLADQSAQREAAFAKEKQDYDAQLAAEKQREFENSKRFSGAIAGLGGSPASFISDGGPRNTFLGA